MMLQSPHRTLDPEEADFFFVPILTSCWFHPIAGEERNPDYSSTAVEWTLQDRAEGASSGLGLWWL